MSALNLSPKNPLMVVALAAGAVWFLSRRQALTPGGVRPAAVGPTAMGNSLSSVIAAVGNVFGAVSSAAAATGPRSPAYAGEFGIGGTWGGWSDYFNQVQQDAAAQDAVSGSDPDGDPYWAG